jgi:pimeloyl-ACP methyl ester carboxylesterase
MIREMLTVVDISALFTDPVFYGLCGARGDGKAVVLIPGFLGNDLYLELLRQWLIRVGYSPIRSALELNAGCAQRLSEQVREQIESRLDHEAQPIALVGHSRGGLLAWILASHFQERVSHLVMLGSPLAAYMATAESGVSPFPKSQITRMLIRLSGVMRQVLDPQCGFPDCDCPSMRDLMRPLSPRTAVLSIYGRNDLIVAPETRITEGQTIEVGASHIGLVYNPDVYRALARFLASKPQAPVRAAAIVEGGQPTIRA